MDKNELADFASGLKSTDKSKLFSLMLDAWKNDENLEAKLYEQISFVKAWNEAQ